MYVCGYVRVCVYRICVNVCIYVCVCVGVCGGVSVDMC